MGQSGQAKDQEVRLDGKSKPEISKKQDGGRTRCDVRVCKEMGESGRRKTKVRGEKERAGLFPITISQGHLQLRE